MEPKLSSNTLFLKRVCCFWVRNIQIYFTQPLSHSVYTAHHVALNVFVLLATSAATLPSEFPVEHLTLMALGVQVYWHVMMRGQSSGRSHTHKHTLLIHWLCVWRVCSSHFISVLRALLLKGRSAQLTPHSATYRLPSWLWQCLLHIFPIFL